ncbi:alpha/beta hydrolase family protein [Nostoc sp.]|uniref:alpha/beta hydrolase family protein n=1 Tax=Nostoc sp. TaxID=1180 RepID=UPI002FF46F2F
MLKLKTLSVVAGGLLVVLSMNKIATAATFNPSPIFTEVTSYTTKISTTNDVADIYFPNPSNLKTDNYSFPIALLLQGANVDKSDYSNYASTVARYGFVVVVPNNERVLPPLGKGLFSQTEQINAVLAQMRTENSNSNSPVAGIVNTQKLGLLGHSFGGSVGLSAIADVCLPRFCSSPTSLPTEVVAGVFYATALISNTSNTFPVKYVPINNSRIPVALLKGTQDGIVPSFLTDGTYDNIKNPPKTLISLIGANHYGITNTNNPPGPSPEINTPTIPQDIAIETLARWSGLFLRASILNDKDAFNYIYFTGDAADPNVTVISERVPESTPTVALFGIGIAGVITTQLRKVINKSKRHNSIV